MFPSLVGSPDTVLRQLHETVEALGLGRVEMIFTGQGLPEALSVASLKLFAREVLPTVQRLDAQPFLDRIELAAQQDDAAPAAAAHPA